jgi:1,4-dihydroxy-2-naphthoyl-CoA hydrolase
MTDYLKLLKERGQAELDKKMGIEIIEAAPERLVATMPVEGNRQPVGLLHGGANVVLAESLGSIGTALHAGLDRKIVGIDINATHHKAATKGKVTGVATPVSLGKTLCTYEIVITNEEGQRTCTARITCLILSDR